MQYEVMTGQVIIIYRILFGIKLDNKKWAGTVTYDAIRRIAKNEKFLWKKFYFYRNNKSIELNAFLQLNNNPFF